MQGDKEVPAIARLARAEVFDDSEDAKASAHLSTFDTKDFHQEVIIPATDSAFHGEAFFARMLLQQR